MKLPTNLVYVIEEMFSLTGRQPQTSYYLSVGTLNSPMKPAYIGVFPLSIIEIM